MTGPAARFFEIAGYYRGSERVPAETLTRMDLLIRDHMSRSIPPYRVNQAGETCRIDHLLDRDPVFLDALRTPAVANPLRQILGPVVDVLTNRHNHATRNAPGDIPFRLHRDNQQWSQPLVSVVIYLEDSTVGNRCTTVVPATHRIPYAGPQSGGGGGNWADEHEEYRFLVGQELPVEVPRGGVLFINGLTFHSVGAGSDSCSSSRFSMVFACRATDELVPVDPPNAVRVFGERRHISTDALTVSGSLTKGEPASLGGSGARVPE